jgi:hypothetical protein
MALICRLYGERDCTKFSEAWMPLAYTVEISGSSFNWGAIISKQLSTNILQAQMPKDGETPTFHMVSYLLDVICARNIFAGMNLRWHIAELPCMSISTFCGRTGTRDLTLLYVMNL